MAKYTAINIGPIITTINLARKPRELWTASYMFSYLMKEIVKVLSKDLIVSPAVPETNTPGIGLYPDRVYVKGDIDYSVVETAVYEFAEKVSIDRSYFNVMQASVEAESDSAAINELNNQLNRLELFNRAFDSKCEELVLKLLKNEKSVLFKESFEGKKMPLESFEDIASNGRTDKWSYNKYICIVQADGDNMGDIISNASDDKIKKISSALLNFGIQTAQEIKRYSNGSLPIYIGGDDLLFVAPVVGNDSNIFDLIQKIDNLYAEVKNIADRDDQKTSLSYGISITYHKYPLYEALNSARNLLDDAKKMKAEGKNALVWELRKHSGGSFKGAISKNNDDLYTAFKKMIEVSGAKSVTVSAVAHKIRENKGLLELWTNDSDDYQKRNTNFFEKYMDGINEDSYKKAALNLLNVQYGANKNIDTIVCNMYSMLRTAKFVKGELQHE